MPSGSLDSLLAEVCLGCAQCEIGCIYGLRGVAVPRFPGTLNGTRDIHAKTPRLER